MRYKNNILDKLDQIGATATKIQFQINRGIDSNQIEDTIDSLKEQVEKIREIISLESDDFEQQFAPRR